MYDILHSLIWCLNCIAIQILLLILLLVYQNYCQYFTIIQYIQTHCDPLFNQPVLECTFLHNYILLLCLLFYVMFIVFSHCILDLDPASYFTVFCLHCLLLLYFCTWLLNILHAECMFYYNACCQFVMLSMFHLTIFYECGWMTVKAKLMCSIAVRSESILTTANTLILLLWSMRPKYTKIFLYHTLCNSCYI